MSNEIALKQNTITDIIGKQVSEYAAQGQLVFPKNYSPDNALKSAWLILQEVVDRDKRPALSACTQDSIANALLDMVVQGLNPAKKQGYFIVYGNKLSFQRSYFGTMAVTQSVNPSVGEIVAEVVYAGDKLSYKIEGGKKIVTGHEQSLENIDNGKIVGAYCIVFAKDGTTIRTDIMTYAEMEKSWKQSKQNPFDEQGKLKAGSVHGKFTADMCKRTVINRTCKPIINASSDAALLLDRINRSDDIADEALMTQEITDKANKGEIIDIPHEPAALPEPVTEKPKAETLPAGAVPLKDAPPAPFMKDDPPADPRQRGTVTGVKVAQGEKNGKPWKRYGVSIDSGVGPVIYGTFDLTLGNNAEILMNQEVLYTFETKGQYKTLLTMEAVSVAAPPEVTDTDLPWDSVDEREPGSDG